MAAHIAQEARSGRWLRVGKDSATLTRDEAVVEFTRGLREPARVRVLAVAKRRAAVSS